MHHLQDMIIDALEEADYRLNKLNPFRSDDSIKKLTKNEFLVSVGEKWLRVMTSIPTFSQSWDHIKHDYTKYKKYHGHK